MSALGPRPAEPDAWKCWVAEALVLIARRPAAFASYFSVFAAMSALAQTLAWDPARIFTTLLLVAVALTLFVRLALVADYNRQALPLLVLPGNLEVAVAATLAAALFAAYGALYPAIFSSLSASLEEMLTGLGLYQPRLEGGAPALPVTAHAWIGPVFVAGGVLGVATAGTALGLLAFGQWFLLPMVVLHGASPAVCFWMSLQAYRMNPISMVGLTGGVAVAVLTVLLSIGWLGPLLAPLLGVVLYTSYRDVFLERSHNHPAGTPVLSESEQRRQRGREITTRD